MYYMCRERQSQGDEVVAPMPVVHARIKYR